MDRYQINDFSLSENPYSGDSLLLVEGSTRYKPILSRAFSYLYFSKTFEDRYGEYDWGVYIKGADDEDIAALIDFCQLLQNVVFIDDDLDQSFALAFHTKTSVMGGYERTAIGQLVRDSKPYDRAGNAGSESKS